MLTETNGSHPTDPGIPVIFFAHWFYSTCMTMGLVIDSLLKCHQNNKYLEVLIHKTVVFIISIQEVRYACVFDSEAYKKEIYIRIYKLYIYIYMTLFRAEIK